MYQRMKSIYIFNSFSEIKKTEINDIKSLLEIINSNEKAVIEHINSRDIKFHLKSIIDIAKIRAPTNSNLKKQKRF